jgi:hypothetical protein
MWRLVSPAHQRDIVKASQCAADTNHPHRPLGKLSKKNPLAVVRTVSPAHQRDIVKASQFAANIDKVNGYLIGWQRGRRSMLAR